MYSGFTLEAHESGFTKNFYKDRCEDKDNDNDNGKRVQLECTIQGAMAEAETRKAGEPLWRALVSGKFISYFFNWSWPLYQVLFICIGISFVLVSIVSLVLCICFGHKG